MSPCRRRARSRMLLLNFTLFVAVFLVIWLQLDYAPNGNAPVPVSPDVQKKQKVYLGRRKGRDVENEYDAHDEGNQKNVSAVIDDDVNLNRYSPIAIAGKMGAPYYVLPSEKGQERALYHINNFNLMVSDRIPLGRSLRDMRSRECRRKVYDSTSLPDTSVIIVFHNEAWSTLMRTVYSVIKRSPRQLIREIILVDDASEREFLRKPLDNYVSRLPVRVKVIRALNRTGLIRARLLGAEAAQGKILTFLDAHCECTRGWLEPLLSRIAHNRSNVVCPVIDVIDEDTFAYIPSFYWQIGAFKWDLRFRWYSLGPRDRLKRRRNWSLPVRTPVMAGGLFAIDKSYFQEIGKYDDQMDVFGGENIELSFRIWQCGGSLEIITCSRVGHVFRSLVPYSFPGPGNVYTAYYNNLARVAATWMDEWANFFFKFNPEVTSAREIIDVSSRLKLREQLKCKSFRWYLENIWPDHFFPRHNKFFGKIRNTESGKCVQVPSSESGSKQPLGKIKMKNCSSVTDKTQLFILSENGRVMADDSVCLDAPFEIEDSAALTLACFQTDTQLWDYDHETRTFTQRTTALCLDLDYPYFLDDVVLKRCDSGPSQEWILEQVDWLQR